MLRWVLRLFLLPLFLVRDVWRRVRRRPSRYLQLRRAPYSGGPVAIIALYQTGQVRADILGLLLALRRRGVYVMAVNTGSLPDAGARLPVDCYVERPNYGRDFGSYQVGVEQLTQYQPPSRLLLLNDSVFYAATGLEAFLNRLIYSAADVCSATESNEVLPHQTSFCLSFSGRCASHPTFLRFWKRYVPMDLRPATVLLGEILLSRVLSKMGFSRETLAPHESVRRLVTDKPGLAALDTTLVNSCPADRAKWCVAGNVTHRAPSALMDLGLPLIKLDLASRAGRHDSDLEHVLSRLTPQESETLGELWLTQSRKTGNFGPLDRLGALCGLS